MDELTISTGVYKALGIVAGYVWSYCLYDWTGVTALSLLLLALLIAG